MNDLLKPTDEIIKVNVIMRSFQAGADEDSFDVDFFQERVAKPIRNLLRHKDIINSIIIVTNGEAGSSLAEKMIREDLTPTIKHLREAFPDEIKERTIITHISDVWGPNPGSGVALNKGIAIAGNECEWILCLSPEIEIDGYKIISAINFARERNLSVVGFMRKLWWERPQWNVGQNTACLWHSDTLIEAGGFSDECDGVTKETVKTVEYGDVLMAGMEDFHAMARLMGKHGDEFRWGMIGRHTPLNWNVNFLPGSEREKQHKIKVARQYAVIQRYVEKIFPNTKFEDVMEKFFSLRHQD